MSGQFLSARMSERSLLRAAGLTAAVGAVVAALAPSPAYGYLGFIILGLGVSGIAPVAFALVGRLAAPARRDAAIARAGPVGSMARPTRPTVSPLALRTGATTEATGRPETTPSVRPETAGFPDARASAM